MSIQDTVAKVILKYGADTTEARRAIELLSQTEQRATDKRIKGLDDSAKHADYMAQKIDGIGKQIAQQKIGEFTRLAADKVGQLTGGVVDLNAAVLGFQAFGPAGALIGAFGKAAAEAAYNIVTMDQSIEAANENAEMRATPTFKQLGGIMTHFKTEVVSLAQSFYGLNFDKLNEQIQQINKTWSGVSLNVAASTANILKFTQASQIAAGVAGFAGLYPVLDKAKKHLDDVNTALDRTRGARRKYYEAIDQVNAAKGLYSSEAEYAAALRSVEIQFGHVATAAGKAVEKVSQFARITGMGSAGASGRVSSLGASADTAVRDEYGNAQDAFSSDKLSAMLSAKLTQGWQDKLGNYQQGPSILERMFGAPEQFDVYRELFTSVAGSISSAYSAIVDGEQSAGQAIRAFLKETLKSLGSRMAIRALEETAEGFAALANPNPVWGAKSAASHFQSAALFAAGSVAAGVAARAVGPTGGASAGAGAGAGASGNGGSGNGGRNQPQQPIIIAYGDPFADDSPRNRQAQAERIVKRALGGGQGVSYV